MSEIESRNRMAVIGAGLMGRGIAHAFLVSGYAVALVDVDETALQTAVNAINKIIDAGVARGKLTPEDAQMARTRLSTGLELDEAASGVELLVESASERLDLKLNILAEAAAKLPEHALIATNTSALSVTELAAATSRPQRVLGMHFFNPVHKMKLVELIRGLETETEAVTEAQSHVTRIGKTFITVNEAPGFTTSRMSALMGNEAMRMLAEGVASAEDIDTAMRMAFNHPMGPLELGDLTGWDTRLSVLRYLENTLGDRFRPVPLIEKLVAAGRHGRKSGRGVYTYVDGQRVPGSGVKQR